MSKFEKIPTELSGVVLVRPNVFPDERGFFLESFNKREFALAGLPDTYVQDNISHSRKGVIRGLHFQSNQAQGKLVKVLQGMIFDIVVDIRNGSPSFGHHIGIELSSKSPDMLFVPVGFAHGFLALEDDTEVLYKVTDFYAPQYDAGICWNDPFLDLRWPLAEFCISKVIVSPKDAALPSLNEIISPFTYGG
ncbi:MAG TPA: dTDP-4-dehydrorhamnose 3,5-epimerase [Methanoregulaceae archaeon]|nr:dTDP-4-dehydrorhamnose 3,5-epimerase [Methanoregulaceae archaeon]